MTIISLLVMSVIFLGWRLHVTARSERSTLGQLMEARGEIEQLKDLYEGALEQIDGGMADGQAWDELQRYLADVEREVRTLEVQARELRSEGLDSEASKRRHHHLRYKLYGIYRGAYYRAIKIYK